MFAFWTSVNFLVRVKLLYHIVSYREVAKSWQKRDNNYSRSLITCSLAHLSLRLMVAIFTVEVLFCFLSVLLRSPLAVMFWRNWSVTTDWSRWIFSSKTIACIWSYDNTSRLAGAYTGPFQRGTCNSASSTSKSVNLYWQPIESAIRYEISYRRPTGQLVVQTTTSTTVNVTSLTPGHRYTFNLQLFGVGGPINKSNCSYSTCKHTNQKLHGWHVMFCTTERCGWATFLPAKFLHYCTNVLDHPSWSSRPYVKFVLWYYNNWRLYSKLKLGLIKVV